MVGYGWFIRRTVVPSGEFFSAGLDSPRRTPQPPNRLRELAIPKQRDAIWVADITYVETAEGWLYVAGVLDRGTRRCVGWAMGDTLATTLPLAALDMALKQRRLPATVGLGGRYSQHEPTRQLL